MKRNIKLTILSILIIGIPNYILSQSKETIEGYWYNSEKTAKVKIYKAKNQKYYGRIAWLKIPIDPETNKPKVDKHNADESLRTEPLMGLKMLKGFEYIKPGVWEDGTIYDPKNGKTYSCVIKMKADDINTLYIRGYVLVTYFGRTTEWKRTTLE